MCAALLPVAVAIAEPILFQASGTEDHMNAAAIPSASGHGPMHFDAPKLIVAFYRYHLGEASHRAAD